MRIAHTFFYIVVTKVFEYTVIYNVHFVCQIRVRLDDVGLVPVGQADNTVDILVVSQDNIVYRLSVQIIQESAGIVRR